MNAPTMEILEDAEALARWRERMPWARIRPAGEVRWFVDEAAAGAMR